MNFKSSIVIGLAVSVVLIPALSHAQYPGAPIIIRPGQYEQIDRAKLEGQRIDWSRAQMADDQRSYQKITAEVYSAYQNLFRGSLQTLRKISLESSVTKKRIANAEELVTAINAYTNERDLLQVKIAAIRAEYDAWKGFAALKSPPAQADTYKKGMLNLAAIVKNYETAIQKIDVDAANLTYRYDGNAGVVTTTAGQGLIMPNVELTPDQIAQEIQAVQKHMQFSNADKFAVGKMSRAISQQMLSFNDENSRKLVWQNDLQKNDKIDWINAITTKARVLKYVRGAYCMPLGVPGLAIGKPTKFNLDYLARGVDKDKFRIADQTEFNERNIRATLTRFDQLFMSLQSQSGEYKGEGTIMKFLNRVNSTLTWHNEVSSYLSVMKILRDNMVDELDLIADGSMGCDKVRARYYAQYVSFKEPQFQKVVKEFLEGRTFVTDAGRADFATAGRIILSKAQYSSKLRQLEKMNIGNSVFDKLMSDLDGELH